MFTPFQENVYFAMGVIEELGRKTNNHRKYIVDKLGVKLLTFIISNAEVLHCENLDAVCNELIENAKIENGDFITPKDVPGLWGVAGTYAYLVNGLIGYDEDLESVSKKIIKIFESIIVECIAHYETDMFYQSPEYIRECYDANEIL